MLGNQLFAGKHVRALGIQAAFLREDRELCTYFRFHQQKLVFFLCAMREYHKQLRDSGIAVTYQTLPQSEASGVPYEEALVSWARAETLQELVVWEIEDQWFEKRILDACRLAKLPVRVVASPMFVTSRGQFADYLKRSKRPFMRTFYEAQRKRLRLLLDPTGKPQGGQWSFDEDNRKPLPASQAIPDVHTPRHSATVGEVCALVRERFGDHPGNAHSTWLPITHEQASDWLDAFFAERFVHFGPYEDALSPRGDFLFHSVLSPMLNVGLLTPGDVLARAVDAAHAYQVPLNSLEGFVRQVVGWREFIRGIYQNYNVHQAKQNFFGHTRGLAAVWYQGDTGIPPLDATLKKVVSLGWAHHIERLMVLGSLLLLLEVAPREAHRWFMEMFVDSSDWVMGPNVYGMAMYSDGGIFATKPYLCGSNYLRKMGGFARGPWCDEVDGLYWRFMLRHEALFARNPRMQMAARTARALGDERKTKIFAAADAASARLTVAQADRPLG